MRAGSHASINCFMRADDARSTSGSVMSNRPSLRRVTSTGGRFFRLQRSHLQSIRVRPSSTLACATLLTGGFSSVK